MNFCYTYEVEVVCSWSYRFSDSWNYAASVKFDDVVLNANLFYVVEFRLGIGDVQAQVFDRAVGAYEAFL